MKTITQLSLSLLTLSLAFTASADTITVESDLDVEGVLTIGNSEQSDDQLSAGMMRWTGTAFECYDGVSWKKIPISVFTDDGSAQWGSNSNSVSGSFSTVWGSENTVSGNNSSAWGKFNEVSGKFSNAWGFGNTADGINVTAWGKNNTASGQFSTVWGFNSNAAGDFSTAWGRYTNASSVMSTALGKFNIGSFSFSDDNDDTNDGNLVWFNIDPLLEIGIGGNDQNRANALTLLKDGRIALGEHKTLSALQDQPETVQVQGALKVGDYATDPGENASEGAIRYGDDGSGNNDLLGYINGTWKSLTKNGEGGSGMDQTLSVEGNQLTISGAGGNTVTLPAGGNGSDGAGGADGATWLTGSGAPDDANGTDGDLYLNTDSGDYYIKASGAWGSSAGNLTGPQGVAGPAGADGTDGVDGTSGIDGQNGATWLTGSGSPDAANGVDGDLYLDTGSGNYYVKASGAWGSTAGNLTGAQGPTGASPFVLSGNDAHFTGGNVGIGVTEPSSALDVSGDIQVDGAIVMASPVGDIPSITYE